MKLNIIRIHWKEIQDEQWKSERDSYKISDDLKSEMVEYTKEEKQILRKAKSILKKKADSLYKALEKRRKYCDHDFEFLCHGHNDSHYQCNHCGEMEDR